MVRLKASQLKVERNIYKNNKVMKNENKKQYKSPRIKVFNIERQAILAGSGVESNGRVGFGGTDLDGDLEVD